MKRGLRFQTKLMLAMAMTIVVVVSALLLVIERRVRETYIRHVSEDFQFQVDQLRQSRDERTRGQLEFSAALAKDPLPAQILKREKDGTATAEFRQTYSEAFRSIIPEEIASKLGPKRPGSATDARGQKGGLVSPGEIFGRTGIIGVCDLEKNFTQIENPQEQDKGRFNRRKVNFSVADLVDRLGEHPDAGHQEIGYLAIEGQAGITHVQEIIATPVQDPDSGQLLGLFIRGSSPETASEKFLERYNREFGNGYGLRSGIFLEDTFHRREMDSSLKDAVGKEIARAIGRQQENGGMDLDHEGAPYRIQFEALNEGSALPVAYQAIIFSLAPLHSQLNDLRLRGSGIGILALALGLLISAVISRNLSVPIRELSEGTQHIREGNFDERVAVRSRDELGELAQSFNSMAEELKQKDLYRNLLGKVSDEAVAQAMISGSLDLELGGELKHVSILFCDIRGFTDLTENMHPTMVIDLLNDHMTAMTRIVREHYGVVDKFVGDEIMAVFGGLKQYGNDARNAAACALEMIAERKRMNTQINPPIRIGIGIATGEVVAGCMGSVDRLNYTVLGARVNLAARLCGTAAPMEALVDDDTKQKLGDELSCEWMEELSLKGFSTPIPAWRLEQRDPDDPDWEDNPSASIQADKR